MRNHLNLVRHVHHSYLTYDFLKGCPGPRFKKNVFLKKKLLSFNIELRLRSVVRFFLKPTILPQQDLTTLIMRPHHTHLRLPKLLYVRMKIARPSAKGGCTTHST